MTVNEALAFSQPEIRQRISHFRRLAPSSGLQWAASNPLPHQLKRGLAIEQLYANECFNALRLTKFCILLKYCLRGAHQSRKGSPVWQSRNVRIDRCDQQQIRSSCGRYPLNCGSQVRIASIVQVSRGSSMNARSADSLLKQQWHSAGHTFRLSRAQTDGMLSEDVRVRDLRACVRGLVQWSRPYGSGQPLLLIRVSTMAREPPWLENVAFSRADSAEKHFRSRLGKVHGIHLNS